MENKPLNSTESIELIQKMITTTRENYQRSAGQNFLIWGYASLFVSVVVITLWHLTSNPNVFWGWWAIPVIGYTASLLQRKEPQPVRTYIDTFVANIWAVLGVALLLIPAGAVFAFSSGALIMPIEGIILSAGVVMMGLTVKLPSITIGGIISGALSFAMFFLLPYAIYIFTVMFITAMIIPGHILNHKSRQCSKN